MGSKVKRMDAPDLGALASKLQQRFTFPCIELRTMMLQQLHAKKCHVRDIGQQRVGTLEGTQQAAESDRVEARRGAHAKGALVAITTPPTRLT